VQLACFLDAPAGPEAQSSADTMLLSVRCYLA
jgi:hypothetical protein